MFYINRHHISLEEESHNVTDNLIDLFLLLPLQLAPVDLVELTEHRSTTFSDTLCYTSPKEHDYRKSVYHVYTGLGD